MRTLLVLGALAIMAVGYIAAARAQICGSGASGCQYQEMQNQRWQVEQFNQRQRDLAEGNWRLQQQADQQRLRQILQEQNDLLRFQR